MSVNISNKKLNSLIHTYHSSGMCELISRKADESPISIFESEKTTSNTSILVSVTWRVMATGFPSCHIPMSGSEVGGEHGQWILLHQNYESKKEMSIDFTRFLVLASLDETLLAKFPLSELKSAIEQPQNSEEIEKRKFATRNTLRKYNQNEIFS